ncbi:ATP-binding cassette domain-containing protein [Agrobacterium leguminum]|uniref:ABC transporter ATP-binding protein n=1 Tax=Agrobacterium leguminum TaxID=2792015 RepID=UPI00272C2208|nr:ATP-binding cassette domain-containing protein [Agrobacterium leguminum]WLD96305.1 ATP-binding cassette domain-containing protein [Agrobacterium leguminum]
MTNRQTSSSDEPLFHLKGVSCSAGGRRILPALDLEIGAGRTIGLIGHNGSGKSTLIKLLARQIAPSAGLIRFGGRALESWPSREFARNVAYMPQQMPTAVGTSVYELVKFGRYPWHGSLGSFGTIDRIKVEEALELTGTAAMAGRYVETLSGGEHQRAWLAALIAQDSRCLLLDEPISALDIAHQVAMLDLVRDLTKTRGLTTIMVLHDVNMAARFSDEIIALHSGCLMARGIPAQLMTPDELQRIYGVAMEVMIQPSTGKPIALAQ